MFSYNEYRNIITLIKNNLPIVDFSEVTEKTEKFCVLRHDIEFSIDRAYELAKVENELGVTSTYTVQIRNNTYNALSEKNIELVRKIKDLGHHIGLHQNPPLMDVDKLKTYVSTDIQMLEYYYGFYIDRFAFHRPKKEYLKQYIQIEGKINCYDKKFFHYFEERPDKLDVIYLSDSNHIWKFGHPYEHDFSNIDKLQILTHPFSWTEKGGDNYGNFLSLIKERNRELVHSMDTETSTFPKEFLI
tara:strand:- start:2940 stop:3671 length:732 start_codon:yes stop_codon:yes gene_type:complete